MRRPSRWVVRLLILVTVFGVLQLALGTQAPRRSPYLSALSDALAGQTQAATSCEMKDCAGGSRHNIVCAKVAPYQLHCSIYHGYCLGSSC
jgi:hypothetical protein